MGDYTEHSSIKVGSEKSFGIVFALVFGVIAFWPLFEGGSVRFWSLVVGGGFLLVAFVKPVILRPLNKLWFQFGIVLGKIITPIVMSVLFLATVTPIALIMRALGKDSLKLKLDSKAATYWVERAEPGPSSGSMRNQF
jgi:hypothetical protein